ncbi:hypothetical protein Y1Q_0020593 [Alligator mississippiensis]|uniref:Uncharacterized protein n=1 Tax=Alligator mississippiensis TaxID=8496 RepID=A0A151PJ95_ALLMI|nr:hypothetical protein Y1Q_0020593 [Alligator mississippiensis]
MGGVAAVSLLHSWIERRCALASGKQLEGLPFLMQTHPDLPPGYAEPFPLLIFLQLFQYLLQPLGPDHGSNQGLSRELKAEWLCTWSMDRTHPPSNSWFLLDISETAFGLSKYQERLLHFLMQCYRYGSSSQRSQQRSSRARDSRQKLRKERL